MTERKLLKAVTNPYWAFGVILRRSFGKYMNDCNFIKWEYFSGMHKFPNIDNPITYNEKLQWLKLNDIHEEYSLLVDKYEAKEIVRKRIGDEYIIPTFVIYADKYKVRDYVANVIGKEYLIPLIGFYKSPKEIVWDELPNQFVLKTTHDSGGVVVCSDKAKLDRKAAQKKLGKSLKKNYFYEHREYPYKDVKPRIIAEQYMVDESGTGLKDYKFFCFDGKPNLLYISRGLEHHPTAEISFYGMDGVEKEYHRSDYKPYHNAIMPSNFEEMREIAEILFKEVNSSFVRIDLYSINEKVYFSEITFSPCSGMIPFEPMSADDELGNLLHIKEEVYRG